MAQYVVKSGDTLWDIASRYLGNGARWKELGFTGNPKDLQPNTVLNIPDGNSGSGAQNSYISNDPVEDLVNNSVAEWEKLAPSTPDPVKPFAFDEELAKQSVTAEISPYYQRLRDDYMTKVNAETSRITEDRDTSLGILGTKKEDYMGDLETQYKDTLDMARQGYAGKNMYFSGKKERTENKLLESKNEAASDYNTQYEWDVAVTNKAANRGMEDINYAKDIYLRDLGEEEKYKIDLGVAGRRDEEMEKWTTGTVPNYYGNSGFGSWYDYVK